MDSTDLNKLAEVFARADRVVTLADVFHGDVDAKAIGLRHDVDGNQGSFENALAMAKWEEERGYRSTYYFLHGTYYWKPKYAAGFREFAARGHEVGFHNNALAIARRTNDDPFYIAAGCLEELRRWSGEAVKSTSAHGDVDTSFGGFMNYLMWEECNNAYTRKNFKSPEELGLTPRSLKDFGLEFQGDWVRRPHYLTDSGGSWSAYAKLGYVDTLDEVYASYPYNHQLIVLQHPDWWPASLFS